MTVVGTFRTSRDVRLESGMRTKADVSRPASSVTRQLPLSPMRVLPLRVEHALDVAVQCSHHTNPCEHRRAARGRDQDQRLHCCLPLRGLMLVFRKPRDEFAGVLEGDELATAGQRDRIVETPLPSIVGLQ